MRGFIKGNRYGFSMFGVYSVKVGHSYVLFVCLYVFCCFFFSLGIFRRWKGGEEEVVRVHVEITVVLGPWNSRQNSMTDVP
jgi:hypothetical protein